MSADGYLDNEEPFLFSNEKDSTAVQKIRGEVDAILVGSNTLRNDDPSLLIKDPSIVIERVKKGLTPQPKRVVLCGASPLNPNAKLFNDGMAETIVFRSVNAKGDEFFTDLVKVKTYSSDRCRIDELCESIYQLGIRILLVEGGASLATQFIESGLVDSLRIAYSPKLIQNKRATKILTANSILASMHLHKIEYLNDMYAQTYRSNQTSTE